MRSIAAILIVSFILLLQNAVAQPTNVLILDSANISEPSIMFNPQNPMQMVAASNLDEGFYSEDGGKTWIHQDVKSTYGVGGDPCLIADDSNNFYYFHLSNPPAGNWIDRIVCQKSSDGGKSWNNGSYAGLNNTKVQDKQWAIYDRSSKIIYMTWTQFDVYAPVTAPVPEDSSVILFSKSEDYGTTWSAPIRINKEAGDCWDDDKTVEGAVPAVGTNGEIYVCWASEAGLMFDRSTDRGVNWLKEDIKIADQPGGWNYDVPGIYRCNGLPIIVCDTGGSDFRGNIYVNWTDQRNGTNNTDVWLIKSSDKGNTWSQPIRVNTDEGENQQFFSWMSVDPMTGFIYIVFYDRRNYNDELTDVYLAVSKDGGASFTNFLISETPFYPAKSVFYGDYTNIVAYNNIIRPIWTRLDTNRQSIWTALIDTHILRSGYLQKKSVLRTTAAPNPSTEQTWFSFTLHQPQLVSLWISDQAGKYKVPVFTNKLIPAGKYVQTINSRSLGLPSGIYNLLLITEDGTTTQKIVFIKNH